MPLQGKQGVVWQAQISAEISKKEVTLQRVVLQSQTGRTLTLRAGKYGTYLATTSRKGMSVPSESLVVLLIASGAAISVRCFRRGKPMEGDLPLLST